LGELDISKHSTPKFLKDELIKMGYSQKAIKEIGKWLPLDEK
jgi:hypothetical protein